MARYRLVWLEIARDYFDSLHPDAQAHVEARLDQLTEDPRDDRDTHYDASSDQWTTTYGDGAGLILFAVVPERRRIIILRLV